MDQKNRPKHRDLEIQQEVENTLSVPDRMEATDPGPFFYERLSQRMHTVSKGRKLFWRPLEVAAVILICLLNAYTIMEYNGAAEEEATLADQVIEDYGLSYEYYMEYEDEREQ